MLFNSFIFIFIFLPITLIVYFFIGRYGYRKIAISWLVIASLFFYGWWNTSYLFLLVGSIIFNYLLGLLLSGQRSQLHKKGLLIFGITVNLVAIGYFKYAGFFISNVNVIFEQNYTFDNIILPLAISFFTFQQIAYLVDAYRSEAKEYNFLYYCLFVTFFPQLIAGPIVHHKEMMPQFINNPLEKINYNNLSIGISIFIIGLFKKVVIADNMALFSTPVFNAAEANVVLTLFEAWGGAFAYTFQLYFDFSGYCDMAIGIAFMLGVKLPMNFNSPYKAQSIIEFWRRWHMTLSRFLRDYLYIPLGGNRHGKTRKYINILLTMLIGGLWHGAGWTFIIWGGMHGIFLMINHAWRRVVNIYGKGKSIISWKARVVYTLITFHAVVVAWVVFRAESVTGAKNIISSMLGFNGLSLPKSMSERFSGMDLMPERFISYDGMFHNNVAIWGEIGFLLMLFLVATTWVMPNTIQIMKSFNPVIDTVTYNSKRLVFKLNLFWAVTIGVLLGISILHLGQASEFLYFQF